MADPAYARGGCGPCLVEGVPKNRVANDFIRTINKENNPVQIIKVLTINPNTPYKHCLNWAIMGDSNGSLHNVYWELLWQ